MSDVEVIRETSVESIGIADGGTASASLLHEAAIKALLELALATNAELRSVRLCFVGQSTYFAACALDSDGGWLTPTFVDYRAGDDSERMIRTVEAHDPDVVVVFKPELVPAGAFDRIRGVTVGFLTEPVSRDDGPTHPDLERRLRDLEGVDPANFDRMLSFDPLMVPTVETVAPVWRSLPLPVADRYYREVPRPRGSPRVVFVGRSTPHRESFLLGPKHRYDIVHIAHGVGPDDLERLVDAYDVGINLHNEDYPNFENRACLHLAAGHLLLSEPLTPTHGLEPGIDFIETDTPSALQSVLVELFEAPDAYRRVRIRGRAKAELFRASRVYPALVRDLLHDVCVFGSERVRR